jgi:hypothetical protein
VQAKQLFQFLKPGEALAIPEAEAMTGVAVYLAGLRLADGELLVVAPKRPVLMPWPFTPGAGRLKLCLPA